MLKDTLKWAATCVVLVIVAVALQGRLSFVITASLFALFAMSWSFFTSFSGYLNLGHVLFIGLSGYTTGALNYHLGWPMWISIIMGVIVGTGVGWAYLYPIHKRITGLSFEMVSFLSVIAISNLVVSSLARPLTGGDIGLSPIDGIFSSIGLALSLAALVCVVGFLYTRYLKSKSGRILDFAREDQSIVRAAGADPHRYTGMLLLLSAIAGALGGALYVHYSGAAVVSNTFALGFMIRIVVMAIIGGRFSLRGSILGAYLVIFITMVLMPYVDAYVQFLVIYALGFVIYFFMPRGLVSLVDIVGSRVPWLQHPSRRRKETIADSSTGEG